MAQKDTVLGVIYVLHGGMDRYHPHFLWDASVQMFSYDPNHPVYQMVIWNPDAWSMVLTTEFAIKFIRKYEFEYERVNGIDPFHRISDVQLADMKATLDKNNRGLKFEVDYACWMAADRVEHYPYPRFMYTGPEGAQHRCSYCGEQEPGGPWPGCKPDRYNVDGPVERLLKKGASRIVMIDTTVGGPRFFKTFDVVQMTKRALSDWNRVHNTAVPLFWVNDPECFMERAYPAQPPDWTPTLGEPEQFAKLKISDYPNPVAADPDLALLHVEGIEAGFSKDVSSRGTGILLFNHGLFAAERKYFDPKIDDTNVLNRNIKSLLLQRHPDMDPENIVGAYGGVKEINPENGLLERTRNMRGEDIAYSYLYLGEKDLPPDEFGYRYWDALEYLKNRGVRHIVIGFPQVLCDSVLGMVELYNQVGKEIGVKTWLKYKEGDYAKYPGCGNPFAGYWGNWVDAEGVCLTMGGCADGEYPPPRKTPLDEKREDMDPSLAFDLSDFGHLGYDSKLGPPDTGKPVQDQYRGTWAVCAHPNCDPRIGKLLAKHIVQTVERLHGA